MSALAQALAKAGVIEKEQAANVDAKRDEAMKKHRHLSGQISLKVAERRKILALRDSLGKLMGKGAVADSANRTRVENNILAFLGLKTLNFSSAANQRFVLDSLQKKLVEIDKAIKPMIVSCKSVEKEWGIKKNSNKTRG